jgi:hypothetical protein
MQDQTIFPFQYYSPIFPLSNLARRHFSSTLANQSIRCHSTPFSVAKSIQGYDTMPNQFKSYNGLHTLMYCIPPNPDRCYFFSVEILTVRYHNLQVIKNTTAHSKKHISHKVMNPQVKQEGSNPNPRISDSLNGLRNHQMLK